MAPKRGDTKTQNGVKYRYGYKKGKLQWIRVHDVMPHIGAKNKVERLAKGAKNLTGNVSRKVFGNPKTSANKKYQSETWTKKPNNKMATWRVDDKENKKLQEEHKSGSDHTYQRVTSKNKEKLSSNKVDTPNQKSKTKLSEQWRRTKERIKKLSTKEERKKRRDARLKKKKNALKINRR